MNRKSICGTNKLIAILIQRFGNSIVHSAFGHLEGNIASDTLGKCVALDSCDYK